MTATRTLGPLDLAGSISAPHHAVPGSQRGVLPTCVERTVMTRDTSIPHFIGACVMRTLDSGILLWIICTVSLAGCDPVRSTLQPVPVEVLDSAAGEPVAGARISLKRESVGKFPSFSAVTDKLGHADIGVQYTAIDRTWGTKPPSSRDWVTGQRHLINVMLNEESEECSLVIRPGASVRGQRFTVSIRKVQKPRYVPTS